MRIAGVRPLFHRTSYPSQLANVHRDPFAIVVVIRCEGMSVNFHRWIMFDMRLIDCIGDIGEITGRRLRGDHIIVQIGVWRQMRIVLFVSLLMKI